MAMRFAKFHGLGNDFVIMDFSSDGNTLPDNLPEIAAKLCNRHTGIGADGLVLAVPSSKADIGMRIFNPDGSEASMCGNAIRCFSKYVYEKGLIAENPFRIETLAGIMKPELLLSGSGDLTAVRVNMGKPILERELIPMKGPRGKVVDEPFIIRRSGCYGGGAGSAGRTGESFGTTGAEKDFEIRITAMFMGVPHVVIFAGDYPGLDPVRDGRIIECDPVFPRKTNVDFVYVIDRRTISVTTWERAAGATLACGTGSCASVVAAVLNGRTDTEVTVRLPLGVLAIDWKGPEVFMTGTASEVFEGDIGLRDIL